MIKNKKILIAGGIILTMGISIGIYQCLFSAPQKGAEEERIVINLTTTEEELIPKLKEQGYIRSEWAFNFVLKVKGWHGKIKPGGYKISKTRNVWYLAETLVNYRYQSWIVIPEGLRKEEIAEMLQEGLYWSNDTKEEFLNYAKEGYLFPDTYLLEVLNVRDAGKKVAKRMESNFNEKCRAIFKEFKEQNIRNDTAIILASIIQREAGDKEQMPLIAGIIWNRLLKPMPLQVDATIQYIVGEEGNWWRPVTPEEYKIESPYNTYLREGRPPAPICNPGLAAIEAVVHDQPSDYFYYLHDSKGQIYPAKTYEEHKENIKKYLQAKEKEQPETRIKSPINPPKGELLKDEILGDLVYCTTACEDTWNYCSLKPTEKRTRKLRLRNFYNKNTIECYIDKRHTLLAAGSPALVNVNKEVFEEIKGDRIQKNGIGIKDLGWIEL